MYELSAYVFNEQLIKQTLLKKKTKKQVIGN